MKRLLKYLLILALLCVMLGIVVPLGLFAYKYSNIPHQFIGDIATQKYAELSNPKTNGLLVGSICSIVIFHLVGAALLVTQQYLWFKANKKEQYPVPLKLTKKYSLVGYLCIALIVINICFASVGFATPIGTDSPKNDCFTRIWIYGAGLIINALFTFAIMGYAEYINLQILYNQNVQMVDEGVANGTYDPETRRPYSELEAENTTTSTDNNETYEDIIVPELDSNDSVKLSDEHLAQE